MRMTMPGDEGQFMETAERLLRTGVPPILRQIPELEGIAGELENLPSPTDWRQVEEVSHRLGAAAFRAAPPNTAPDSWDVRWAAEAPARDDWTAVRKAVWNCDPAELPPLSLRASQTLSMLRVSALYAETAARFRKGRKPLTGLLEKLPD
ncbi:hypothetical protein [Frankia sp. Cj3]|uniref:hypothetical protein n=1 Tax=Frankia sp. Cj3 TaxID=2880976 RepID=UPI001EF4B0B1|nr:hypothetical protein [Frankia sp. Cj3]